MESSSIFYTKLFMSQKHENASRALAREVTENEIALNIRLLTGF